MWQTDSNNHFLIEQPGAQERGHQKIGSYVLIMQDESVSSEQDLGIMFNEGMSYRSTAGVVVFPIPQNLCYQKIALKSP